MPHALVGFIDILVSIGALVLTALLFGHPFHHAAAEHVGSLERAGNLTSPSFWFAASW